MRTIPWYGQYICINWQNACLDLHRRWRLHANSYEWGLEGGCIFYYALQFDHFSIQTPD